VSGRTNGNAKARSEAARDSKRRRSATRAGRTSGGRAVEAPDFYWHVASVGDRVTLALGGELDVANAAEARTALLGLQPPRGGWLVIDLRDLSFMDSTGIHLILEAKQHAEKRGATFALIRGARAVHRALEIVGLAEQALTVDDVGSTTETNREA
jgi:anti-sigma B factor antagonist